MLLRNAVKLIGMGLAKLQQERNACSDGVHLKFHAI